MRAALSHLPVVRVTGLGRSKESFMARKPHARSVAAASGVSTVSPTPSAALAAPGAALASPPAPARTPCRALLGPRPLIDGEDETNYDVILERISADVAPADFVEEIWVRNVVDLVWDSVRLRRLKSQLLQAGAGGAPPAPGDEGGRAAGGPGAGISAETRKRKLPPTRLGKPAGTGPTSAAGKARSAQNARKHGLNVAVMYDPDVGADVAFMAEEIAPGCPDPQLIGRARRIAGAQVDLMRVAPARPAIISAA